MVQPEPYLRSLRILDLGVPAMVGLSSNLPRGSVMKLW